MSNEKNNNNHNMKLEQFDNINWLKIILSNHIFDIKKKLLFLFTIIIIFLNCFYDYSYAENSIPLSATATKNISINDEGHFQKIDSQIYGSRSFVKLNDGKVLFKKLLENNERKTAIFDPKTNNIYYNTTLVPESCGAVYGVKLKNGEILYVAAITKKPANFFSYEIYNLVDDENYRKELNYIWHGTSLEEQEKIYMPYLKNNSDLLKRYNEYKKEYEDSMYGWLYNPSKDTWRRTKGKVFLRRNSISYPTLLSNGNVLLIGGFSDSGQCNDIEIYNPDTELFELKKTTKKIRNNIYGSFPLKNGKVMFLFGDKYIFYNPETNTYSQEKDLNLFGKYHIKNTLMLSDEKILMFVGYSTPLYSGSNIKKIIIFDPNTEEFIDGGTLAFPRGADATWMFDVVELKDGRVLIMGGQENIENHINRYSPLERSSKAEIYDPKTKTSKLINDMNYKRINSHSVLLDDGRVLIFDGSNKIYKRKKLIPDFEVYIPKNYKK